MIRFNLLKLLKKLEAKEGRRYPLKEVAEKSGCDKNALSRIVNQPNIIPSANIIDKLVQFFFFELTRDSDNPHLDKNRMMSVVKDFVCVYPDNEEFRAMIPASLRDNPNLSLSDIWDVYTQAYRPVRVSKPKEAEIKSSLKAKFLEAESSKQEGSEIELTFTQEEFDLLRSKLHQNMGGTLKN
jgi:transcriptional regulator with XRE-family HTH domain